ncbi:MAG: SPOR domain-containing protein [Candidatus Binatus sp.]|uniref:SPOR domain-containing protein n=1 Tax=Candidatus Binatus sp. TaxID=2811406 RepID=UPI0027206466|nr:SPOR domain-containing protein [Candidatus Binatus sp.]MDO8433352.1 SPOR domain-containing protein [Candidatus Binatus sp.]
MRFELKFGGAFVILVGLFTLSGAVFLLGLYAGYQMAWQNQPALNQISSTYPLPSAPAGASTPASAMTPAAVTSPAVASGAPIKPIAPRAAASIAPAIAAPAIPPAPIPRATAGAIARAKPPAIAPAAKPPPADEGDDETDAADSGFERPAPPTSSSAAAGGRPGHKPFNIQIEAVMDKSGADEMVARLRGLGYNAQESTTNLGGQTWYRVRVGPYNSEDEARSAEQKLRDQYKHAFAPR